MKNILRLSLALTGLAFSLPNLHADSAAAPAPAAPAATEPNYTITLPANLKAEDVVSAVTKGFSAHNWAGVSAEGNTVTASHSQSGVSVKAKAVCTASDVKVFADYKVEGKVTQEKAKKALDRWFRNLEKTTKEELGLLPKPASKEKKPKAE